MVGTAIVAAPLEPYPTWAHHLSNSAHLLLNHWEEFHVHTENETYHAGCDFVHAGPNSGLADDFVCAGARERPRRRQARQMREICQLSRCARRSGGWARTCSSKQLSVYQQLSLSKQLSQLKQLSLPTADAESRN